MGQQGAWGVSQVHTSMVRWNPSLDAVESEDDKCEFLHLQLLLQPWPSNRQICAKKVGRLMDKKWSFLIWVRLLLMCECLKSIYLQVFRGCDELSLDRFLARHKQRTTSVRFSTCNFFAAIAV
ncbi:hypothetical protein HanPSC8_Chr17g0777421 [Helianthus annuus]|nr:hypothetical protein HanPSC8_Chr17g0777421 [Helianthus annuus]